MNKIFKIVWNEARKMYIVVSESQRTRGKRKSAVLAAAAAILAAAVGPAAADVTSGWQHTKLVTNGNITRVTTNFVKDTIGVNRFSAFDVNAGNIVNLCLPDQTNNLVNFVESAISIHGTVNSLKGAQVGGNLFFVTPEGMTVGKTGVINAGSLTALVTTKDAFDKWSTLNSSGGLTYIDEDLLHDMRAGEVPLNPSGVITVEGSINAGNRIVLAASKIDVKAGAAITNTRSAEDFKRLVNITAADGTLMTSAEVEGGLYAVETEDGSGDILLLARSDTSGSVAAQSAEARITVAGDIDGRENVTVRSRAGNGTYEITGTGEEAVGAFVETGEHHLAEIKSEVTVSGSIEAAQDLTVEALAENRIGESGLISLAQDIAFEIAGATTPFNFDFGYGNLTTRAELTVTETGRLAALGSLTARAAADTSLTIGTSTSSARLLDLLPMLDSAKIPAAGVVVGLADSAGLVTIDGHLSAGKNLTVKAEDALKASLSAEASTMMDNSSHVAVTVGKVKGAARVDVNETAVIEFTAKPSGMTEDRVLEIAADHTSSISTSASASVEEKAYGAITFNYTEHDSSAAVNMRTGTTGETADTVRIAASNVTSSEDISSSTSGGITSGLSYKQWQAMARASQEFASGLMNRAVGGIDPALSETNFKLGGAVGVILTGQGSTVSIDAPDEAIKALKKLEVSSVAEKLDHHYSVSASSKGDKGSGQQGATKTAAALAVLVAAPSSERGATVASDLDIGSDSRLVVDNGAMIVESRSSILYDRFNATVAGLKSKFEKLTSYFTKDGKFAEGWKPVQAAYDEMMKVWEAETGVDAFVEALGEFTTVLGNFLEMLEPAGDIYDDVMGIIKKTTKFLSISNFVNTNVSSSASGDAETLAAAGGVGVVLQSAASNLTIDKGAHLSAQGSGKDGGAVTVTGSTDTQSVMFGGRLKSFYGIPLPTESNDDTVGASILWHMITTDNDVLLREGSTIDAEGLLTIAAEDAVTGLTIGANADVSKTGLGVEVNAALTHVDADNMLWVDDEVELSGSGLLLEARRSDTVQTIAGAAGVGMDDEPSTNVGAGVAVHFGEYDNTVAISDNDVLEEGETSLLERQGRLEADGTPAQEGAESGENDDDGADDGASACAGEIVIRAEALSDINAVGVAAGLGVAGQDPAGPANKPNALGGKLTEWAEKTKGAYSQVSTGLGNAADRVLEKFVSLSGSAGTRIHDLAIHSIGQNSAQSDNLNNQGANAGANPADNPGQMVNNGSANAAGANAQNPADADQAAHFQLSASASVAWNDVESTSRVDIKAADLLMSAPVVETEAVSDRWTGAWAGAAGMSFVKLGNEVDTSASAGGAVGVNTTTSETSVTISRPKADDAGLTLADDVESMRVYAVADGTTVAEALAAAVSAGTGGGQAGSEYSFDASVSANLLDNAVRADVEGVRRSESEGAAALTWDQAAWNGETQVTGGTGFGLSTEPGDGGRSVSFGLIAAVADIENDISASLKNTSFERVRAMDVRALASLAQVTTAVGADVALGDASAAFTGAAAAAHLTNNVSAEAENTTVALTDAGTMEVAARDATSDEDDYFDAVSSEEWHPAADGELANAAFFEEVALVADEAEASGSGDASTQRIADFLNGASMVQTTVAVSAAGTNTGKAAAGAGIVVNEIDNAFTSEASAIKVTGGEGSAFLQSAESGVVSVAVATGVAAAAGGDASHFAAAGSIIVSNIDQLAESTARNLEVSTGEAAVDAGNTAATVNVAGNVGVSLGQEGSGLGAAVVVMNTNNDASLDVADSRFEAGSVELAAHNRASAWAAAADATVAGQFAIGGSVAVNRVVNTTAATASRLTLSDVGTAALTAVDESTLMSLAGAVAVSNDSAGAVGAVAYSISQGGDDGGTRATADGVTVERTGDGSEETALTIAARGADKVRTLVLAGGAARGAAGFAGAAGVNDIDRTVSAGLRGLSAGKRTDGNAVEDSANALGELTVEAVEEAEIDTLGIVGAYGENAGVGVGIAVNRINTDVAATLAGAQSSSFDADTVKVHAKSADEIEAIGIGGAASQNVAVTGSVGVNLINANTRAALDNVSLRAAGAALVEAQSDDVIGAYVGQGAGAGKVAAGLSVLVNERRGETAAAVAKSSVTQTGESEKTLTAAGSVADEHINDGIVNDIGIGATLEEKRAEQTIAGAGVQATSTTTFKSFIANGAGAGTAAGVGTAVVTYNAGSTGATVTESTLNAAGDVAIEASDALNVDNISVTGAGAGTGSGAAAVNVVTSEHATGVEVDASSIRSSGGTVSVKASGKEGVSTLALEGTGAGTGAGALLVNVTRELSDVYVNVARTGRTVLEGRKVELSADYLGRFNALGIAGAGSGTGAGAVSVAVNYADNDAALAVGQADIKADESVSAQSGRRTETLAVDVTAAGAGDGSGAGVVMVNTYEGTAGTQLADTVIAGRSEGAAPDVTLASTSSDKVTLDGVSASGSAYGSGGAAVMINRFYAAAATTADRINVTADDFTMTAEQNRHLNAVNVFASGATGVLGANVVANLIGAEGDGFLSDETGLASTSELVDKYLADYADASSSDRPGALSSIFEATGEVLTDEERAGVADAADTAAVSRTAAGETRTRLAGSTVKAETVTIASREDTGEDAGINVQVGSGQVAGGLFAASVATLNVERNLAAEVTDSTVFGRSGIDVQTEVAGEATAHTYEASVGLVSGTAAYTDVRTSGAGRVRVSSSTLTAENDAEIKVGATDASVMNAKAFGINVTGVGAEGTIADLFDNAGLSVLVEASTFTGASSVKALRDISRTAAATSGAGGAASGMAARAKVTDSGGVSLEVRDVKASGASFSARADNSPEISADASEGYASAINVGVLHSQAEVSGKTIASVRKSELTADTVTIGAASGRASEDDSEALKLSAKVSSNGAAVAGGFASNDATAVNASETTLTIAGTAFGETTDIRADAQAAALYDVVSDLGTGGVLAGGNSYGEVRHEATVASDIASENVRAKSLTITATNRADAEMAAYSAGGTVIDFGSRAAHVNYVDKSLTSARVAGSWSVAGDARIAATNERNLAFGALNVKGTAVGGSSVLVENTMKSSNTLDLSGTIRAEGDLAASARTDIAVGALEGKDYAADTAVYGAVAGAEARAQSTIESSTAVKAAENTMLAAGKALTVSAYTDEDNTMRVRARTAGAADGVTAYNDNAVAVKNTVDVGRGAVLENFSSDDALVLSASSSEVRRFEAVGDLQGAAVGGAGAKSENTISHENAVSIAEGSAVVGAGDVALYAGRDAAGTHALFDYYGYTHAYAHTLLGGADSALKTTFNVKNSLDVAGDVTAVRDIDAAADTGDWSVNETSRYWLLLSRKDAGSVKIASSAAGSVNPDNFNPVDAITVEGTLTAGTQTAADITISGLVNKDPDVEIEGAADDPEVVQSPEGAAATIETGLEDVANLYWERYAELRRLIVSYGDAGDDEKRCSVTAYKAEADMLKKKMIAAGYAVENDKGEISLVSSDKRGFVKVSDLTVSGGSIHLTTGKVTGTGAIRAQAADHITITNESNLALKLEDVRILEKGGTLTFNSVVVSELDGFDGRVVSKSDAGDPVFTVASKYAGGEIVAHGTTHTIKPDNSVVLSGIVANDAGDLTVTSAGDITILAERVAAAGDMTLSAAGGIMQTYTEGILNTGGGVEELWTEEVSRTDNGGFYMSKENKLSDGFMVAGGDIYLNADIVNINGLVQSGFSSYTLEITGEEAEAKIRSIREQWIARGAPTAIDPTSSAYLLTDEGAYRRADGSYARGVASWYDPVNDRIIVDDIAPAGGHIYVTGRIASTGGGKFYAAAGSADVNINAGAHGVMVGDISTGNAHGVIEVTDTAEAGASVEGGTVAARVTRWTNDGSGTSVESVWRMTDGSERKITTADVGVYAPKAGQVYMWSTGVHTGTVQTVDESQRFTAWDLFNWGDPSKSENLVTTTVEDKALGSGAAIADGRDPKYEEDAAFVGWTDQSDVTNTGWKSETWTTYDNWTHWSGTHHRHSERHQTSTDVRTYTVRADNPVAVEFLSGGNTIAVTSGADIALSGRLEAAGGAVTLEAGGDIFNANNRAEIAAANTVTLTAHGDIGAEGSAVRLSATSGTLVLAASGGGSLYLDASSLAQGAVVKAGSLTAGRDIELAARGNLEAGTVTGVNMHLTSAEGDITISKLLQSASADGAQRFDAAAAGSVTLSAEGDLGLGKVTAGDAVVIKVQNGALTDAVAREDLDNRNAAERIDGWIEAGILGENGANNGEARWQADVDAQTAIVTADYNRYAAYEELDEAARETLTAEQASDWAALAERFEGASSLEAALEMEKADAASALAQTIAAKENYGWSAEALLFAVSDAIINPDPGTVPAAGEPNIEAKTINITTSGSVGAEIDTATFRFEDLDISTEEGLALYKMLAGADVGDVVWNDADQTVTVALKRPISVKLTGEADSRIDVDSQANAFVASDEHLTVGRVAAADALRLTSQSGIAAADAQSLLSAHTITLRAGAGALGSSAQPLAVNVAADDGWIAATAGNGIYLTETEGAMRVLSAASGADMRLEGQSIVMGAEASGSTAQGVISAESLTLVTDADGTVGTEEESLRVSGTTDITFVDGDASDDYTGAGVWLDVADVEKAVLKQTIKATEGVRITSTGGLVLEGDVAAGAGGVELASQGALDAAGRTVSAAGGAVALEGGSVDVMQARLEGGSVAIEAQDNIAGNGAVVNADAVALTAKTGAVALENAELTARTSLDVSAARDVTLDDTTLAAQSAAVALTSTAGSVDLNDPDAVGAFEAASLQVNAAENVMLAERAVKVAGAASLEAGGDVSLEGADMTADSIAVLSKGGAIEANKSSMTADDGLTLVAAGDVTADGSALSGSGVTLTSEAGAVTVENAVLTATEGLAVRAARDVMLENTVLETTKNTAVAFTSTAGSVDLSETEEFESFEAASLEVTADQNVNVSGLHLTTTGSMTLKAAKGNVTADEAQLSGASVTLTSSEGGVTAEAAVLSAGDALAVRAARDVMLENTTLETTKNTAVAFTSTAGSVDLSETEEFESFEAASLEVTADQNVNVSGLHLTTTGAMTLKAAKGNATADEAQLSGSSVTLTSDSASVTVEGAVLSATKTLFVSASSDVNLAETTLEASTAAVEVVSAEGGVNLSATGEEKTLAAADLTVNAFRNVDLTGRTVNVADKAAFEADGMILADDSKVTAANALTLAATDGVTAGRAHLTGSSVMLTASEGGVTAEDAVLSAAETLSVSASSDVNLAETTLEASTAAVEVVSAEGGVNLSAMAEEKTLAAADLTVNAFRNVDLTGRTVNVADKAAFEADGMILADDSKVTAVNALTLAATDGVTAGHSQLAGSSVMLTASEGGVTAEDAVLSATETLSVSASSDVNLAETMLKASTAAVEVVSAEGGVNLSATGEERTLAAADLTVNASGNVDLSHRTMTIGNDGKGDAQITTGGRINAAGSNIAALLNLTMTAAGDVEVDGAALDGGRVDLTSAAGSVSAREAEIDAVSVLVSAEEGAIEARGAQIGASAYLMLKSAGDVNLTGTKLETTDATKVEMTSLAGGVDLAATDANNPLVAASLAVNAAEDVNLSGRTVTVKEAALFDAGGCVLADKADVAASGITMRAQRGNVSLASSRLTAAGTGEAGSVAVEAGGAVEAPDVVFDASGALSVAAQGSVDLSNAELSNGTQLLLRAGVLGTGSRDNVLNLTGVVSSAGAAGVISGTSVTLETSGTLMTDEKPLEITAGAGDVTVLADKATFFKGSSIEARGGDARMRVLTNLEAGESLKVIGRNVEVTGGRDAFAIGSNAVFEAVDGSVRVVGDADVTLGGSISASAKGGDIVIGGEGVFKVAENDLTITAEDGAVTVYGGQGMSITDDLTIVSAEDAAIKTDTGDLSIGNEAVIKAGSESGLPSGEYGGISVLAGGSFTIGESASMYADNLLVEAAGDVRFGSDAHLAGTTDGVVIRSTEGSIHMGEALSVESAADATSFEAALDIVIDRAGSLESKANEIRFTAGRDVLFGNDFTAEGEGFVVTAAAGDVRVGDDAHVKTVHSSDDFQTLVSAADAIVFGERAEFDTTELKLETDSGDIVFGADSRTQTSVLGITVEAGRNVHYGENAEFGTTDKNSNGDILISAASGTVTIERGVAVSSGGALRVDAEGDVTIGEDAVITGDLTDEDVAAAFVSRTGDVTIGAHAQLAGRNVWIGAGSSGGAEGGSVRLGDGAEVETGEGFTVLAARDIVLEGAFNLADVSDDGAAVAVVFDADKGSVVFADAAEFASSGIIDVDAGGDIRFGRGAYLVSSPEAGQTGEAGIDLNAGGSVVFDEQAVMRAADDIRLTAGENVVFARETDFAAAGEVSITSQGAVDVASDASVYGGELLDVTAGSVTTEGNSRLNSWGLIRLTAVEGDIVMRQAARVGSVEEDGSRTKAVSMSAAGSILQNEGVDGMGVAAETITLAAAGDVLFGAVDVSGDLSGNMAETVRIEAGGSVALGLTHSQALVSVNEDAGGVIDGALVVHGQHSDVTFAHDVAATGEVQLYGKSLTLRGVTAGAGLYAATAGYGQTPHDGIRAESLVGDEVALMTGSGSIEVDEVTASGKRLDVYRIGLADEGTLKVGSASSGGQAILFNANGAIDIDLAAQGPVWVLTGFNSALGGSLDSAAGKVVVIDGAQGVAYYLSDEFINGHFAQTIDSSLYPRLDLSEETTDEPNRTTDETERLFEAIIRGEGLELDRLEGGVIDNWTREILSKGWYTGRGTQSMPHDLKL